VRSFVKLCKVVENIVVLVAKFVKYFTIV